MTPTTPRNTCADVAASWGIALPLYEVEEVYPEEITITAPGGRATSALEEAIADARRERIDMIDLARYLEA